MAIHLGTSVSALPGIGPKAVLDLKRLGICSVRDLLLHIPFRYDDFSLSKPIPQLRHDDSLTIEATIQSIQTRRSNNGRVMLTEAVLANKTGELVAMWFNQPYLEKRLCVGSVWAFAGRINRQFGKTIFMNPVHEPVGIHMHTGRILPVYRLSGSLALHRLRECIRACSEAMKEWIDWIPEQIQQQEYLCHFSEALHFVHLPSSFEDIQRGRKRLAFDEHFLRQLMFACVRQDQTKKRAAIIPIDKDALKTFVSRLPFELTLGQRKAAWEIIQDLAQEKAMNRLLQGDVGSGKTVVAALASVGVLRAGKQMAYLAPTELLAKQQYDSFCSFFPQEEIGLLTRSMIRVGKKEEEKKVFLERFMSGELTCVIGTHALLQESVSFSDLSFVIIDEQHRFGVEQRHALLEQHREIIPHLLSMTATPIPRSLALSVYGDLDVSRLSELPKGRRPITTTLIEPTKESLMYDQVRKELEAGHQAFVVCPAIDSEHLEMESAERIYKSFSKGPFKAFRLALLHGQMKSSEKEHVMTEFVQGKIHMLISTSVVEVGIDVPNATVMMIRSSHRFGLAQLHQLRGRVGRGEAVSFCFLCSGETTSLGRERLQAVVDCQDGYLLAEKDLLLRGAGNVFGTVQSGFPEFQFADPFDIEQMKKARYYAQALLQNDSSLEAHPLVKQHLSEAFEVIHLE